MNETDATFVSIIHGMDPDEVVNMRKAAYNAQVDAVVKELEAFADHMAEHFDVFVVAGALHNVWTDYDRHIDGLVDDE